MTTEKELYRLSREQFKEAFKYYYEAGKAEAIKECDDIWFQRLKEHEPRWRKSEREKVIKQVLEIIDNWENKYADEMFEEVGELKIEVQKLGELAK